MSRNQPDLFEPERQSDLLEQNYKPYVVHPDPNRVRARLQKILAEAKAAQRIPWDSYHDGLYRVIFPQMTRCLPPEEASQLCLEFEAELERLKAA